MQKMLTITIQSDKTPNDRPGNKITVNEVPEINRYLGEGWLVDDWEILNIDNTTGIICLLCILTDEKEMEDDYFTDWDDPEEDDEENN